MVLCCLALITGVFFPVSDSGSILFGKPESSELFFSLQWFCIVW